MTAKKGFTLIELLVVIAIIGILSAVVLTSLNSARAKAQDAKIKSELSGLRAGMELFYDGASGYGTDSCAGTGFTTVSTYLTSIDTANDGTVNANVTCESTGSAYAVSSPLRSSATTFWCVDSAGHSGLGAAQSTGVCA